MNSLKVGSLAVALCVLLSAGRAVAVPAVVGGTELLYVREGPGTDYPVLSTLPRGDKVEAETTAGAWVRVRLAGGREGYVFAKYVRFPEGRPAVAEAPAAGADSGAAGRAAAMLEQSAQAPRGEAAKTTPPADSHRAGAAGGGPEASCRCPADLALRADVRRLLHLTGELHRRVFEAGVAAPPPAAVRVQRVDAELRNGLFAAGGLFAGGVIGLLLGRRKERRRRSRIRL